ncbi:multidrug efflux system CmeDEF, outer membrane component CmeD [Campylobacter sp. RM5004]|uniref:TolC family protein n=1 Tax=Campylobacter sp. RM5004 TaxID=1660078 RepID=UPI001EFABD6C|nr:TolC family protein [Campylobacter sp. RM5004]ULO01053.1 multidrug efflux system CmeDEF, outer membrane component CmeD [Campylobacter sp. RM5004]
MKKLSLSLLMSCALCAGNLQLMLKSIENNEQLKAKNYETQSKEKTFESIKYKYYPSVSLQGGFVSFDLDKYLVNPNNILSSSISVDALIYDGKREQNIKLSKKDYELNKLEEEKIKNELELKLVSLYYSYLALAQNIEYKNKHIEYLKASLNRLEKLNQVGLRPDDELEIFRAKLELVKNELQNLNYQKDEILSNIYLITNEHYKPLKGSAVLLNDKENNSYDVRISALKDEMGELNKELSLAGFKPIIFAKNITGLGKNNIGYAIYTPFNSKLTGRLKDKMFSNVLFIGFSWNIFAFGADKKAYESAKLTSLSAKELYMFSKKNASEKEKLLNLKIDNLKEEIIANEKVLQASELAFSSIAKKYEAGLVSYVEYLNALESSQGALAKLSFVKAKLEITKAELLYNKGLKISDFVIDL